MEGESAGGATGTAANLGDETSEEVRKRAVAVPKNTNLNNII